MGSANQVSGETPAGRPEQQARIRTPGTPYEVSRAKIMEFAEAIGDPNPLYHERATARLAGYRDVIAPPTFGMVVALPASIAAAREVFAGTDSPIIVHVEQRFDYTRPIQAGDVLHADSMVTSIREMRGTVIITTRTEIRAGGDEHVCTASTTLATFPGDGGTPS
jgi:acyl dehydratase